MGGGDSEKIEQNPVTALEIDILCVVHSSARISLGNWTRWFDTNLVPIFSALGRTVRARVSR